MNTADKVAVCSPSFCSSPVLRTELLKRYQRVLFNEERWELKGDTLVRFLKGCEKAIVGLEVMNASVLSQLPELKVISKYGVGLDMIDVDAMRAYGKRLGWTAGVNRRSVSELVIAFIISMLRQVPMAYCNILAGGWSQHFGRQLTGRIVGIIGCGCIGKDLVRLLQPFECQILVNDIRNYPDFYAAYSIEVVSLEALLTRADIVTLHVPLDDSTRGLLDAERLGMMKPSSVLINIARGGIVDEMALKQMLQEGKLAATAFDVFSVEPPQDRELLSLPNFLATPHIGGRSEEAILAMGRAAIEGLDRHILP